jgi:hypothetical protein
LLVAVFSEDGGFDGGGCGGGRVDDVFLFFVVVGGGGGVGAGGGTAVGVGLGGDGLGAGLLLLGLLLGAVEEGVVVEVAILFGDFSVVVVGALGWGSILALIWIGDLFLSAVASFVGQR